MVLEELKSDILFHKPNNLLLYTVPQQDQVLDNKTLIGKVTAVWDLEAIGAYKIHNKGEEKLPGTNIYEFQILINHQAVEGIYEKCVINVTKMSLSDYKEQLESRSNSLELKEKLKQFIKIENVTGKQAELLNILSDFEPKKTDELAHLVASKDIKDLKKQVQQKLNESDFSIKTIKSSSFKKGAYQLLYVPSLI